MEYKLAGINLSNSNPFLNEEKTTLTWTMQVVVNIDGAPESKFEQIDTVNFETGVEINAATIEEVALIEAEKYINETYPNK